MTQPKGEGGQSMMAGLLELAENAPTKWLLAPRGTEK